MQEFFEILIGYTIGDSSFTTSIWAKPEKMDREAAKYIRGQWGDDAEVTRHSATWYEVRA